MVTVSCDEYYLVKNQSATAPAIIRFWKAKQSWEIQSTAKKLYHLITLRVNFNEFCPRFSVFNRRLTCKNVSFWKKTVPISVLVGWPALSIHKAAYPHPAHSTHKAKRVQTGWMRSKGIAWTDFPASRNKAATSSTRFLIARTIRKIKTCTFQSMILTGCWWEKKRCNKLTETTDMQMA